MTREEKAKAFDEALEKAKEYLNSPRTCFDIEQLYNFFPQLCESEDERTRRWILEKVQGYASSGIPCSDEIKMADKAIAYLEKQKDASKAIEAVDRIDKYIDEHLANAHDMKDSNPDKKYYRGWDDALGEMARILQDVYSNEKQKESLRDFIDNFPYSVEKEQKPVELSDDELQRHQDELYNFKVFAAKQAKEYHISFVHDFEWNNFCAELLSYFNEKQNPTELSKEETKDLVHILKVLDDCYVYGQHDLSKTDYDNLTSTIKSLKPSWKPSEHQMRILKAVKEYVGKGSGYWGEGLGSLIDDLEKLI